MAQHDSYIPRKTLAQRLVETETFLASFSDQKALISHFIELSYANEEPSVDFMVDKNVVPGCQVMIYIALIHDQESQLISFRMHAQSRIIGGLLQLLMTTFNPCTKSEVMSLPANFAKAGVWKLLFSSSRRQASAKILDHMIYLASQ